MRHFISILTVLIAGLDFKLMLRSGAACDAAVRHSRRRGAVALTSVRPRA